MTRRKRVAKPEPERPVVLTEHHGKGVTVISDRDGVQHFVFACAGHDSVSMLECPSCWQALKSIRDLQHHRRGMPTFDGELVERFYSGWATHAA